MEISIERARAALDAMESIAMMDFGVDPAGPYAYLRGFIDAVEKALTPREDDEGDDNASDGPDDVAWEGTTRYGHRRITWSDPAAEGMRVLVGGNNTERLLIGAFVWIPEWRDHGQVMGKLAAPFDGRPAGSQFRVDMRGSHGWAVLATRTLATDTITLTTEAIKSSAAASATEAVSLHQD